MTVNMKVDLVGKERRGLALGLNEFAGYLSVAVVGFVTGYLAAKYGLKPYPFYLGIVFAVLGLVISWIIVKDTRKFTILEIKDDFMLKENLDIQSDLSFKQVFLQTSLCFGSSNGTFIKVNEGNDTVNGSTCNDTLIE